MRKLLLSFPQVMDYNLENHLKPIADYYISDVRFSATEFGSIVTRFPRLFSYSLFKIKHVTGFLRFEVFKPSISFFSVFCRCWTDTTSPPAPSAGSSFLFVAVLLLPQLSFSFWHNGHPLEGRILVVIMKGVKIFY